MKNNNLIYKSDHNRKRKNQVVLLMITDNEQEDTTDKWHYLALKSIPTENGYKKPTQSISRLFRGITSNHNRDFYCLGCLHFVLIINLENKKDYVIIMIFVNQ